LPELARAVRDLPSATVIATTIQLRRLATADMPQPWQAAKRTSRHYAEALGIPVLAHNRPIRLDRS
jgi:hypothetical protein